VDHIDAYCICDTGSTDDTVQIIQTFFAKYPHIQGKICSEPFRNFSYNRNVALRASHGMSDFVLLIDADMVLQWKSFAKSDLWKAEVFMISQGHADFMYHNTRIIKNSPECEYKGVTHEYIGYPNHFRRTTVDSDKIFILDIGDGGAKSDKVDRDIRLLVEGIREEPKNDRYHFYLANTYFDSGRFEEAIAMYEKRIEMGGWIQEVWYSWFRLGLIYFRTDRPEKGVDCMLSAYDAYPDRLENWYEIMHHYRNSSKNRLALHFYEKAISIRSKLSKSQIEEFLFCQKDVYNYLLQYEYSIVAYYAGIRDIRLEFLPILRYCNSDSILRNTISNLRFYMVQLPISRTIDFTTSKTMNGIRFFSSSPCLIPFPMQNNKYIMNVRFVNYEVTKDKGGYIIDPSEHITTINECYTLDQDFQIIDRKECLSPDFPLSQRYEGIEDVRLFSTDDDDSLCFMGTSLHRDSNKLGIMFGRNYPSCALSTVEPMFPPAYRENVWTCEKNWVFVKPVNCSDPFWIVYQWHPLQICRKVDSRLVLHHEIKTPTFFQHVRGSTSGFLFDHHLYFLVHFVHYDSPRNYFSWILVFDERMERITHSSHVFTFETEKIEYCLGMIVEKERFLFSYSTWDHSSKIAIVPRTSIPLICWT